MQSNTKRWLGYLLIASGFLALGSFFFLITLPPIGYGLLIVLGAHLVFGGLKFHGLHPSGWLGLILLFLGLAALGSFFFFITLPPIGYGALILLGAYLSSKKHTIR